MAETYLNLGNTQIDQQNFLTTAANNVQAYVAEQPWSKKKKERFLTAYQDIMQKGISGASNNTGIWAIDTNENIDLSSMSKKDQEMYSEAAYFILNQMNSIAPQSTEEEVAKEDLPVFDATLSTQEINRFLENNLLGGQQLRIGGERDNWNYLDERGDNGLRGIANRADKLASVLEGYANSLQEGKYNFEGTAYQDLNDLKSKLLTASQKLRSGVMDQSTKDALNQIGLDWRDYFNDGSGDIAGTDASGNPITYADLATAKQQEAEALAEQTAVNAEKERKANQGVLNVVSGARAVDAIKNPQGYQDYLAKTYGVGDTGYNAINTQIQSLLSRGTSLNADEKRQLGNFIHYIRTNNPNYQQSNITDQEWQELGTHSKILKSTNKDDFIRLPWQTQEGRYVYADKSGNVYFLKPANKQKYAAPKFVRSQAYNDYRKNFLMNTGKGVEVNRSNYLNSTDFTDADRLELAGIAADIASIIDPEPFSAGTLGVGAALARNIARNKQPGKKSLSEHIWQGVDYLTGALGAAPGLGDAALVYKVGKNVAKWGRRLLAIPAVYDLASNTPGAVEALNKTVKGEKLTAQDYINLGSFFRGLTGTHNITVQNRATRRSLEKHGYDLSDQSSWVKKAGLLDTSVPTTQATVKVKVKSGETSKEVSIPIKDKAKLDKELRKAGNKQEAKDAAIRSNEEVKTYLKKNNLKEENVSAIEGSSLRNSRIVPNRFRTAKNNFGNESITKPTNKDVFDEYLKTRSGWDKLWYGSNRTMRGVDPLKQFKSITTSQEPKNRKSYNKPTTMQHGNLPQPAVSSPLFNIRRPIVRPDHTKQPLGKVNLKDKELVTQFQGYYRMGDFEKGHQIYTSRGTGFGGDAVKAGKFQNELLNISLSRSQAKELRTNPGKLTEFRARVAKQVQELINNNKVTNTQAAEMIRGLKRKGYLKQGGQIEPNLDTVITEFLNKQK